MIDAHLHLQDERIGEDVGAMLEQCEGWGIRHWVVNGTGPDDWPKVAALASRYPEKVLPCYGLHPWRVSEVASGWEETLRSCLERGAVGVGEVGLDKWIRNHDLPRQREALELQLALADTFRLPVMLHCLQAWGSLKALLEARGAPVGGFLLHSFGGPVDMIPDFVEMGGYFSFSGHFLAERKRRHLEECLERIPRERLLVETDAPDMGLPDAQRRFGGADVNHPANLMVIYEYLAKRLSCSQETCVRQINRNSARFLGMNSLEFA